MNRRRFLERAVAVGALGALAGCPDRGSTDSDERPTGTPADPTTNRTPSTPAVDVPDAYAERFDDVVDLGATGVATDASSPINQTLDEAAADDTLLYLPEGRYLLDGHWKHEGFENVGLYGPEATIVPPEGYAGDMFILGDGDASTGLVVDGLSFDVRVTNTGPRVLHATIADGLLVRDLSVSGIQDTDQGLTRFDVTDPEGSGRVQRMRMEDGGKPGTVSTGCLVGPLSEGTLTFEDCRVAGFPDNGIYGSPAPGPVKVYGGRFANNGISNLRVSGASEIRGAHVVCDEAREGVPNMRGVRLRRGEGTVVRDCLIELREVTTSDGAVTLSTGMGSATVADTTIRVDADSVPAIRAKPPGGSASTGSDGSRLTCENVTILGDAAEGRSVHVADRDASSFRNLCVQQTGVNRDGLFFLRASGSVVADSSFDVTGEAVVARDSDVRTRAVETRTDVRCLDGRQ